MISVIVVNYNSGSFLKDCIKSVLHQVDEALVIDNASMDNSLEQLITCFKNEARLITYMPDEKGDLVPIPLGALVQIKAVYFGYLCPDIRVQTIKKILSGNPDIQYYKMNSTPEDIYHLTTNPL